MPEQAGSASSPQPSPSVFKAASVTERRPSPCPGEDRWLWHRGSRGATGRAGLSPGRGCCRDDSSGNSPASPGAGGTAGRSQEGARWSAEGAGSAMTGSGISACRHLAGHRCLCPCLSAVPGAQAKLSQVQPILRRPSPDTGLPPVSGGRCRRLRPAGCPAVGPRCSGPAGTASPASPGR